MDEEFYKPQKSPGIVTTADGNLQYADAIRDGYTVVELPSPKGSANPTKTFKVRELPRHIVGEIESHFDASLDYLRKADPVGEFAHWSGALQGAKLVDKQTGRALDKLLTNFAETDKREQQKFFQEKIAPFIVGLGPKAR